MCTQLFLTIQFLLSTAMHRQSPHSPECRDNVLTLQEAIRLAILNNTQIGRSKESPELLLAKDCPAL